jgi:transcriptional regulator with PAS, ATPase and Fis domain
MDNLDYLEELPIAVTVCDKAGTILFMNAKSAATFENDGGKKLIGTSLLDCHQPASRQKIADMLQSQSANTYTIEKNGKHKLIHQTPWYAGGECQGLIEFSFEIPQELPHFIRG